jgi:hypothetical protein
LAAGKHAHEAEGGENDKKEEPMSEFKLNAAVAEEIAGLQGDC